MNVVFFCYGDIDFIRGKLKVRGDFGYEDELFGFCFFFFIVGFGLKFSWREGKV